MIVTFCGHSKLNKPDGGRLISSFQCDSRIADAEFLFAKRQYLAKTGRRRSTCRATNPSLSKP